MSSHECLLVLDKEFLIQKIVEKATTKKNQKIIGTLGQTSFRDTEEIKKQNFISVIYRGKKEIMYRVLFFISGKVCENSASLFHIRDIHRNK